ncbi:catalase [Lewinella marina]|uniref:Catalase n=1 Tax=Neolewinella marina TaxID=438751 RepID=A0A2G0CEH8_9BACT|nr:catalase [Neolewinella marina]NJB87296.1 catalase [Neolewinella marina]PHK98383.1 catalase HPII [Neolewinella marina]
MSKKKTPPAAPNSAKNEALEPYRKDPTDQPLTTNMGLKVNDTNNSLKSGIRGGTLLEDFLLREKINHFDHERIPERIVHARGSAAHGVFELYEAIPEFTKAGIFNDTSRKTPVFVRFSTVAGSKGSPDLARDVRGFAVKFYTEEGVWDLVGNNMPIFFIQDAMKFPDLIHSVKPEPDREIPQAQSAHDTFYDFVSLSPETLHNHIWVMSDRAIPRSFRMMEGFGIHTFRMINAEGVAHFVRFHWKPKLGVHSVTWDEAVKINGADPDFHRRDLWDAIDAGQFPEWELGLQIIPEADEHKFPFDLLDATKLIPEEMVPVKIVGKMTLNRNPDNFFAETEQVAFLPTHLVPGLDFSNDPLLQGRLFSYRDTQLSRLGSVNFEQIPINQSIAAVHNNQRDGHMQMQIPKGKTAYFPNTLGGGCPFLTSIADGAFESFTERIDGHKIRARSESFVDYFSQPALFYRSLNDWEKAHVADAYTFELGKCTYPHVQQRMLFMISQIDEALAKQVADGLGLEVPDSVDPPVNQAIGPDDEVEKMQPREKQVYLEKSDALSQTHLPSNSIATRQIAVLAADGFDADDFGPMRDALEKENAMVKIVAPHGGTIKCTKGHDHEVFAAIMTTESVLFDAVYIPGGQKSVDALLKQAKYKKFVNEAFKHCKAIAADGAAVKLLDATHVGDHKKDDKAVFVDGKPQAFIKAIAQHRNFDRMEVAKMIPV